METWRVVEDVDFMGGNLALDFTETIGGPLEDPHEDEHEFLRSYGDLVMFGLKTGTLSERSARRLRRLASEREADAEAVLAEARRSRALVESVFRPISEGSRPPARALAELRDFAAEAIAHGALELAVDGPLDRIKTCGRCRWLFLDTTKNHSRRWCSTEGCGTDVKKERYV